MENQEKKITKEQLEELQGFVSKMNQAATQIGNLELQKHQIKIATVEVQQDLSKLQSRLETKYGKVQINIQDGTYKPIPEEGEEAVEPEVLKEEK